MPREEKGSPMGSYDNAPSGSGSDSGSSLAARRAKLRGSLTRMSDAAFPSSTADTATSEEGQASTDVDTMPQPQVERTKSQFDPAAASGTGSVPAATSAKTSVIPPQTGVHSTLPNEHVSQYLNGSLFDSAQATAPVSQSSAGTALPAIPDGAIETLQNIDGALNACATNLAALQRLSEEQTEVLKGLTTTLQNQTLFEIGLNLNSLTESLSAALEPMKAIGELVPAMDQLVSTLEARESDANNERLSPDQLITSLADQLSAGLIDPWTFKCAYMAIYPSEHPADLLHRLVELLGTQRLSGDLFRAAYEAVQGAEPPTKSGRRQRSESEDYGITGMSGISSIDDEEIRRRIDELQEANEELVRRQEERERELSAALNQKDQELQDAQELLNSRYDEFNSRYDEVADMLNKREEEYRALVESKDMELVEKESELNLLRAQMEELRNQTEEMVKDLQKQLSDVKIAKEELINQQKAAQSSSGSFFDPAPQQRFEPAPAKTSFQDAPQATQSQSQSMQAISVPQQSQTVSQGMPAVQAQPAGGQSSASAGQTGQGSSQQMRASGGQPASTPFTGGSGSSSGSYGSGVRAQVFEVIVRQALAGAPWREICAGPMQVNNISADEVEAEVKRRQALLNK